MKFGSIGQILQGGAGNFSPEVFRGQDLRSLIWSALDETDKWHKRRCILQAPLVFCGVIAMCVFRSQSIVNAFNRVVDSVRGLRNVPLKGITDEAIYHARGRLGAEPLRWVARALGTQNVPEASFLGFIPCALDGVKLRIADTPENEAAYGRPGASRGAAAYPQIGGAALLYVDTRKVIDCVWGRYNLSELAAAKELLPILGPQHILFLDRRYTKVDLWFQILERGVHMVHRLSGTYQARRTVQQGEGDWLVEIERRVEIPPEERRKRKRWRWERRTMRVIEYQIDGRETVRLITDLLDPEQYPAKEIALGYHLRWEIELTYDEWQTHLATVGHGTQHTTFRSKTPDGVLQEAWALVAAYNLLRGLLVEAGEVHSVPPLEISFVDSLEVIRMAFPQLQACLSERTRRMLYRRMLNDIAKCRLKRPRRKRTAPRVVKVKMSKFKCKRPGDHSVRHDFAAGLQLVDT
jgi:hypothetical protein